MNGKYPDECRRESTGRMAQQLSDFRQVLNDLKLDRKEREDVIAEQHKTAYRHPASPVRTVA